MRHDCELSARERAVLFALLSASGSLSNAELEAQIGIRLEGKERRKLNDLRLVESARPGREFVHELSDGGLAVVRGRDGRRARGQADQPGALALPGTRHVRASPERGAAEPRRRGEPRRQAPPRGLAQAPGHRRRHGTGTRVRAPASHKTLSFGVRRRSCSVRHDNKNPIGHAT